MIRKVIIVVLTLAAMGTGVLFAWTLIDDNQFIVDLWQFPGWGIKVVRVQSCLILLERTPHPPQPRFVYVQSHDGSAHIVEQARGHEGTVMADAVGDEAAIPRNQRLVQARDKRAHVVAIRTSQGPTFTGIPWNRQSQL